MPAIEERPRATVERPLTLAIVAMGGQGGGVLSDWIVSVAEDEGWVAQSTSVPGVAQRTGATLYYVEMMPPLDGRVPVLSLVPSPGDVDVVMAAEFAEAGRSILRGIVTPDRTTFIASTHRALTILEKEKPGNGLFDSQFVSGAIGVSAKRSVLFDMQALADANGSVISSAMFGALAGTGVLPFGRQAFEKAIRAGGKGVEASLRAFGAAFERARNPQPESIPITGTPLPSPPAGSDKPELDRLLRRIHGEFPGATRPMLFAGVRSLTDYQDPAYANEYLDRVMAFHRLDDANEERGFPLTVAAAKYLAMAMAYDDVIRVADLKTRASRFNRIDAEVGKKKDQLLYMTEFMHPRMEEVIGMMPASLGRWLERQPSLVAALDKVVNRGRRVRTGTVFWFMSLYAVSSMKAFRRRLLRHEQELRHIGAWTDLALATAPQDYELAVETLRCRNLVKGYSDTHARGQSKFDRVVACVPSLVGKPDSAGWLRRLRLAALADEQDSALDGAIRTIASAFSATEANVA